MLTKVCADLKLSLSKSSTTRTWQTEQKMNKRLHTLISEIREKCNNANCFEFDYHWEYHGLMWHPWFLTINGSSESFSFNDISHEDLKELCDKGRIELIKEYSDNEKSENELDKKRYRLIKKQL